MIQIYTGNGKGKTTAAFGLAARAAGHGINTAVIQFMKNGSSGEVESCKKLGIICHSFGKDGFVDRNNPAKEDIALAQKGLEKAREIINAQKIAVLILDEINNALFFNLISVDDVKELLSLVPDSMEVVLTGRNAPETLIETADLVTEMQEIKHPWQKKIPARCGIEW